MYDNEKLNQFLEEGETIKWSGIPQPYGLFDETHRISTIIPLCCAVVCAIIIAVGYCIYCVSKGIDIKEGFMVFCALIPLVVAYRAVTGKNNIKKLIYAVTDKRVVIASKDKDKPCTMRIGDIDGLRSEEAGNGNYHIRIGSPMFKASAKRLSSLACDGKADAQDAVIGTVFYNVSGDDEKVICNLLKSAIALNKNKN